MSKPGADPSSGISLGDALRLPKRHPACRRREAQSGSGTERENLAGDVKGKGASGSNREAESTDAPERGGLPVVATKQGNARGAKGAGHRRWAWANWVKPGGARRFSGRRQPSSDGTSRMMREYQVRFCEGLGVKLPGSTRPVSRVTAVQTAMRNCTRDEGRPFEVGNQVLISSHRKLLSSKAMVVNVAEKPERDSGRHD